MLWKEQTWAKIDNIGISSTKSGSGGPLWRDGNWDERMTSCDWTRWKSIPGSALGSRMWWLCLRNRNPGVRKAQRVRLRSCMRRENRKVDGNPSSKASENIVSYARSYAGEILKLLKIHVLRSSVWLLCINGTGVEQNWSENITLFLGNCGRGRIIFPLPF